MNAARATQRHAAVDVRPFSARNPRYSWRLLASMIPQDHEAVLKAQPKSVRILVGERDELFEAATFGPTVHAIRSDIPVEVVPGVDHIGLTVSPQGIAAIVSRLNE